MFRVLLLLSMHRGASHLHPNSFLWPVSLAPQSLLLEGLSSTPTLLRQEPNLPEQGRHCRAPVTLPAPSAAHPVRSARSLHPLPQAQRRPALPAPAAPPSAPRSSYSVPTPR